MDLLNLVTLFADASPDSETPAGLGLLPVNFWPSLLGALVLGLVGIVMAAFGVRIFDAVMRKIDFEKELAEKQNVAVAIVVAAFVIGVFHLVATVVR